MRVLRFLHRLWHQHPRLVVLALILAIALPSALVWRWTRPGARFGPIDGTWYRSQINKDLYIGLDPSYPPFTQWTPEQIEGIEADLARELGRRWGVKASILIMGYDGLYNALFTGEVDMVISQLRYDPAVTDWVYYTQPYYDAGQILVSRADAPIQDMHELDGYTIAVELASAGDAAAQRWQRRLHSLEIIRYMLPNEAMLAVQRGEVEAALVDTVSARLYLKNHNDLVMADKTTVSENYVIALRRANFRMIEEVEQALEDIINDGTLDNLIARWL